MNWPAARFVLLILVLFPTVPVVGKPLYSPNDYPELSRRIPFFQERLTSEVDWTRYVLRGHVSRHLPLREAALLLRRMAARDPYENTREQATVALLHRGYSVDRKHLPRVLLSTQIDHPDILKQLRETLAQTGPLDGRHGKHLPATEAPSRGREIMLITVLGDHQDLRLLQPYLKSKNVYVRFLAANATIHLGDSDAGRAALMSVATTASTQREPLYIRMALTRLHNLGDRTAVGQMIQLLRTLYADQRLRRYYNETLMELANLLGIWKDNAEEWERWRLESTEGGAQHE